MSRKKIAVCDMEQTFVNRLVNYVQESREGSFEMIGICDVDEALEEKEQIDIWLLGQAFWIKELLQQQQVILLGEEYVPEVLSEYPAISKYQAAGSLVKALYRSGVWTNLHEKERKLFTKEPMVVGVYSPDHSVWQKGFSLALALKRAEHEKVLYVNLQENSGLSKALDIRCEYHLGDVVYALRKENAEIALKGYVTGFQEIDLIGAMPHGTQLGELRESDYEALWNCLHSQAEYTCVVIDFGMMYPTFLHQYGACEEKILFSERKECSRYSKEQFLDTLRLSENGLHLEDTIEIELSGDEVPLEGQSFRQVLGQECFYALLQQVEQRKENTWSEQVETPKKEQEMEVLGEPESERDAGKQTQWSRKLW